MIAIWLAVGGTGLAATIDDFRACADGDAARCLALAEEIPPGGPRTRAALVRGCELGSAACCEALDDPRYGASREEVLDVHQRRCEGGDPEGCRILVERAVDRAEAACAAGYAEACDRDRVLGLRDGAVFTRIRRGTEPIPGALVARPGGVLAVDTSGAGFAVYAVDRAALAPTPVLRHVPRSEPALAAPELRADGEAVAVLLDAAPDLRRGATTRRERYVLVLGPDGARLDPFDPRICLRLTPRHALIAAGPDGCGTPHLAPVDGGRVVGPAVRPPGRVVAPAGEGRWLLEADGEAVLWADGAEIARRPIPSGIAPVVADLLVLRTADHLEAWDPKTLETRWRIPAGGYVEAVGSPDRRWLVFAENRGPLQVVDVGTGREVQRIRVGCQPVAWDAGGSLGCQRDDRTMVVLEPASPAGAVPPLPGPQVPLAGAEDAWRGRTVSGVVRDEAGRPLAGVLVRAPAQLMYGREHLLAHPPQATTDARGRFALVEVPDRAVVVTAVREGYARTERVVDAPPKGPVELELTPAASVILVLDPAPARYPGIEVRVICDGGFEVPYASEMVVAVPPRAFCQASATQDGRSWRTSFVAGRKPVVVVPEERERNRRPPRKEVWIQAVDAVGAPAVHAPFGRAQTDARGQVEVEAPVPDTDLPDEIGVAWRRAGGRWTAYLDRIRVHLEPGDGELWVVEAGGGAPRRVGGEAWLRPRRDYVVLRVGPDGTVGRTPPQRVDGEHRFLRRPEPGEGAAALEIEVLDRDGLPAVGVRVAASFGGGRGSGTPSPLAGTTDVAGRVRLPTPWTGPHVVEVGNPADPEATGRAVPGIPLTLARGQRRLPARWEARPGAFGLVVRRAVEVVRNQADGITWNDVIVEACGEDVREVPWEAVAERIQAAGGCDGVVIRDLEHTAVRLPPPFEADGP